MSHFGALFYVWRWRWVHRHFGGLWCMLPIVSCAHCIGYVLILAACFACRGMWHVGRRNQGRQRKGARRLHRVLDIGRSMPRACDRALKLSAHPRRRVWDLGDSWVIVRHLRERHYPKFLVELMVEVVAPGFVGPAHSGTVTTTCTASANAATLGTKPEVVPHTIHASSARLQILSAIVSSMHDSEVLPSSSDEGGRGARKMSQDQGLMAAFLVFVTHACPLLRS